MQSFAIASNIRKKAPLHERAGNENCNLQEKQHQGLPGIHSISGIYSQTEGQMPHKCHSSFRPI